MKSIILYLKGFISRTYFTIYSLVYPSLPLADALLLELEIAQKNRLVLVHFLQKAKKLLINLFS